MNSLTKSAIKRSVIELLGERKLSEITISDIVKKCGVSRRTFYCYYNDTYALLDDIAQDAIEKIIIVDTNYDLWSAYKTLISSLMKHRTVVLNIYRVMNQDVVFNYFVRTTRKYIQEMLRRAASGREHAEKDIELISNICLIGIASITLEWIHSGMITDMSANITRFKKISRGIVSLMLRNASEV